MLSLMGATLLLRDKGLRTPNKILKLFHMEEANDLDNIINVNQDLFLTELVGKCASQVEHKITLLMEAPVYQRAYHLPHNQRDEID